MEFIEEEKTMMATEKETLSKVMKQKANKVLELLAKLSHTKERVKQMITGSARPSEIFSYKRTSSIKEGLGYEMKGNEKEYTLLKFVKETTYDKPTGQTTKL